MKTYALSDAQVRLITGLLYCRVVKLQQQELACRTRKELIRLRSAQRTVRRLIAVFEPTRTNSPTK